MAAEMVTLVEVGIRDGFQSVGPFIPTDRKIAVLNELYQAGLRRIEVTSFVSPKAVPQLADAAELVAAARPLPGLDAMVLVPTLRHAEAALQAGADHLAFVISVSPRHNLSNVKRTPAQSADEYRAIAAMLPKGTRLRLNLSTAFDCPFDGDVDACEVLALAQELAPIYPAEIALCDTTGRVVPSRVEALFTAAQTSITDATAWVFHGHDTYGMGVANVFAAYRAGVRVFDASVAGLGGCPFAPGATGNVATEDLAYLFGGMGVATGIDLDRLIAVADDVASLPGAQTGGRVRLARAAARLRE